MTFTQQSTGAKAVEAFKNLEVTEQLISLSSIYSEIALGLPKVALGIPVPEVAKKLIEHLKQLPEAEQMQVMGSLISESSQRQDSRQVESTYNKEGEELLPGEIQALIDEYRSLSVEFRLLFWYQLAQEMGRGVISIPVNYSLSAATTELLNSFHSLRVEQQMNVLKQII